MANATLIIGSFLALAAPTREKAVVANDYPGEDLYLNRSAAAFVEVLVSADGKSTKCKDLELYGDQLLATKICSIVMRRKFHSATLGDGTPVFGVFRGVMKFFIPDTTDGDAIRALQQKPDFALPVSALPDNGKKVNIRLVLAVDENGAATECDADSNEPNKQLATALCQNLSSLNQTVRYDDSNHPVKYVTNAYIQLFVP